MQHALADKQPRAARAPQRAAAAHLSPFTSSGGIAALQLHGSPRMLQQQALLAALFGGATPAPKPAATPVVQRLGKQGHIALGAAIGTVVPVLGTILGGYIGYRIWKSNRARGAAAQGPADQGQDHQPAKADLVPVFEGRKVDELQTVRSQLLALPQRQAQGPQQQAQGPQREGKRFSNEQDDGPLRDSDRPVALLQWIEDTRDMIQAQQFAQAYARLIDPTEGAALGITVNVMAGRGEAENAAKRNMSFATQRSIKLCVVESAAWLQEPVKAGRVLPMHLEEYMHQYQAMSQSFLSRNTEAFKQQSTLPDQAQDRQVDAADFDEIDVMAKLIDWGFDVQDIGYIDRYDERETFWEWWQVQGQ